MLTIDDCIGLSDLEEGEIDAIAEHEHIPEMVAVELGAYLIHLPDGKDAIRLMIREDIAVAEARHNLPHAERLKLSLQHFRGQSGAASSALH